MEKELIVELENILEYHRIQIEDIQEPDEVLRHMHYVDVLEDIINTYGGVQSVQNSKQE